MSWSSHQFIFCNRPFLTTCLFCVCGYESLEVPKKRKILSKKNSKKNSLWLLPFFMAVATSFRYEKVRTTMGTATVSYLVPKRCFSDFIIDFERPFFPPAFKNKKFKKMSGIHLLWFYKSLSWFSFFVWDHDGKG